MAQNSMGGGPPHGPITSFVQDVPPPGGYAPVNYKRNIPKGGVSSVAMAAGMGCLFGYGMWKVIMFNRQRREWRREELDIRMSIMPFLSAEADVQCDFLKKKWLAQEAELMKNEHGWEVGSSSYKTTVMPPMEIKGLGPMFPRI
uniref:NADH dehydrogenase [ubiquinone] 1 alpha subcomplex subunit 13 n=1 Tax=Prymnesium polylepis TaxID=72548 RepID=A0A6T7XSL9_9EUKA|mmetsp:Transcript_15057/g.38332  ORF Transcript_15057/g.38332 Transcript_15057/m.38332 type:complete len:144 (+) Transcript_15057:35-466(+)